MKNAADWGFVGVLGTVCTVLLGTAGVALRQVAGHNSTLIARAEKREEAVDALNKLLIDQAFDLGELRGSLAEKARDLEEAVKAKESLKAEVKKLNLERETRALEMLGLKHVNENLVKQIAALEATVNRLKGKPK